MYSDFSRSCRFAAGRWGHGSAGIVFRHRDQIAPHLRSLWLSRSCRFAAGRSGHGSAGIVFRHRDQNRAAEPLGFPALGYGPRATAPLVVSPTDRIALYLQSAIFPALAASRRAARATAPLVVSPTDRMGPSLRSAIVSALAASQRAARATAPQIGFAERDRDGPYLRSLWGVLSSRNG